MFLGLLLAFGAGQIIAWCTCSPIPPLLLAFFRERAHHHAHPGQPGDDVLSNNLITAFA